ncbi:MAG: hypothetical protein LBG44_10500 [Gemmatimonadota bacterium]|jgi:hypothetical protein|nr:hypothetical protein [Gemmatimonadota bacterium]
MGIKRILGLFPAAAAAALIMSASPVTAQVSATAGAGFVGKWTLALEPIQMPGGAGGARPGAAGGAGGGAGAGGRMGGNQTVEITTAGGQLAAKVSSPMGGDVTVQNIKMEDRTLVLSYSLSVRDQTIPSVMRLTPDGSTMKVQMETSMAGRSLPRSGTATKQ